MAERGKRAGNRGSDFRPSKGYSKVENYKHDQGAKVSMTQVACETAPFNHWSDDAGVGGKFNVETESTHLIPRRSLTAKQALGAFEQDKEFEDVRGWQRVKPKGKGKSLPPLPTVERPIIEQRNAAYARKHGGSWWADKQTRGEFMQGASDRAGIEQPTNMERPADMVEVSTRQRLTWKSDKSLLSRSKIETLEGATRGLKRLTSRSKRILFEQPEIAPLDYDPDQVLTASAPDTTLESSEVIRLEDDDPDPLNLRPADETTEAEFDAALDDILK